MEIALVNGKELAQGLCCTPNQNASNLPFIYNPSNTHMTPQFHVMSDEGFTSMLDLPTKDQHHVMTSLDDRASWIHSETENHPSFYDNFWTYPQHILMHWLSMIWSPNEKPSTPIKVAPLPLLHRIHDRTHLANMFTSW
jgi:hypothetical protein